MKITLDFDIDTEDQQVTATWAGVPVTYAPPAKPRHNNTYLPLRADQRSALFAAFDSVFGTTSKTARALFTRVVLERDQHESVSWADVGNGVSEKDAHVLLNALDGYERVQSLYG